MSTAGALNPESLDELSSGIVSGGLEVIDELASEWRALCEAGPQDEPFFRPEWIGAYVRAFAPTSKIVIAMVRISGRLVALLPLLQEIGTVGGFPARKLRSPGNAHTCRYDLVHAAPLDARVLPAMWRALLCRGGWDVMELENVPLRGAATQLVRYARREGYLTHGVRGLRPPYLPLTAAAGSFDTMLARTDSKFRANIRRRMRRLEARGPVRLVSKGKVDGSLTEFYKLEGAGWKGANKSAIASSAPTRQFYDEVASEGARFGYLRLYTLECGGRAVAMHYGLKRRDRFYLLKTAYEERFRDCSPGQLVTHEVLRALIAEQATEFDFLGGLMNWKSDWSPRLRPLANWYVFRGAAGRALCTLRFTVRPQVGRALIALGMHSRK
jgi:CelD/BcsL family acetyltransferase involved in cellulose biosynthesis